MSVRLGRENSLLIHVDPDARVVVSFERTAQLTGTDWRNFDARINGHDDISIGLNRGIAVAVCKYLPGGG